MQKQRREAGFREKMVDVVQRCPKAILKVSVRYLREVKGCKKEVKARDMKVARHLRGGEGSDS